jgi:hypothetical protein
MGTMPMARANSTTVSKTAGLVFAVPMTSAVLNFQIWLAKCRARKRSGRPVKSFMSLGSRVEEFVAKIVCSGASAASFS